ncbi:MAG: hypothetical protein FJ363_04995 [Gemmatimonadetes bacterium]|nr:hypothetical protein [Gemmatimonadota bacterium]
MRGRLSGCAWCLAVAGAFGAPAGGQNAPPAAPARPPIVWSAHQPVAGEARRVEGRVVKGARDAMTPVPGAWVVLHRVGTDAAGPLDSMRTDGAGRYRFRYRTTGAADAVYFVSSNYAGIAYFTPPLGASDARDGDAVLVVHDTTSAPLPIRVRGRHVIISAAPSGERRTIIEVYELSNDGTQTRVAAGDGGATWEGRLLDGAERAQVGRTDFSGGAVRFDGGRVRLSAPIAPGLKQLSFSYDVPRESAYTLTVDDSTDVLEVLVEDSLGRATGGRLAAAGPAKVEGRTFARYLAQDVAGGTAISIEVPGDAATSASQLRILAIMAALGAVLLVGLARAMFRRQAGAGSRARRATAEELRAELSALDAAHAAITDPTPGQRADHYQARAILAQRLSEAVAREQGLS